MSLQSIRFERVLFGRTADVSRNHSRPEFEQQVIALWYGLIASTREARDGIGIIGSNRQEIVFVGSQAECEKHRDKLEDQQRKIRMSWEDREPLGFEVW